MASTITETTWQEKDLVPYMATRPVLVFDKFLVQHFQCSAAGGEQFNKTERNTG